MTFWIYAVLALVVGTVITFIARDRGKPLLCPACSTASLRLMEFIRATIVVDGRRAPEAWAYFQCDECSARFKQYLGGELTTPSDEEWDKFCKRVEPSRE
jgi:hypothetical protein